MHDLQLTHYINRHETILKELLDATPIPAPRIKKAMEYALFPGGKRLRPMLVYACGLLSNTSESSLDMIAAAVEMMHAYSLVHDDLPAMDNDDLRRGLPTCHRAFDEATAILVGDGLQSLAIETLVTHLPHSLSADQILRIIKILTQAIGPAGMISGQSLDLSDLKKSNLSLTQLETIHHLKTGRLMQACIDMVLVAGVFSSQETAALQQFGRALGLLFQIQDDYLDRYAPTSSLGKNRSSDEANHKQTFATFYQKQPLFDLINEYLNQAEQCLTEFNECKHMLLVLLDNIRKRI